VIVAAALLMAIGVYLMAVGFSFFRVTMSLIGLLLGGKLLLLLYFIIVFNQKYV
jgi:hypothetical protein